MAITIHLPPKTEEDARSCARAEGLTVGEWITNLAVKNAVIRTDPVTRKHANLSDLLLDSPFRGSNLDLERKRDD
jgi:hypothetical protein